MRDFTYLPETSVIQKFRVLTDDGVAFLVENHVHEIRDTRSRVMGSLSRAELLRESAAVVGGADEGLTDE